MSASLGLFRLQQVDRQIDRANSQIATIQRALENDVELKNALEKKDSAQAEHFRAANNLKNSEAETSAQKIKIQQTESSLYGGSVKNPKELQDLQKEIASLKKHLVTLEERELEAMLNLEKAEEVLETAKTELELLQAKRGSEHKKWFEEQSALTTELARLKEERSAANTPIESHLLETYETLRRDKRGVAVTEVSDNACASCGSNLNAALIQNARSAKLAYCPSCGRILYVK